MDELFDEFGYDSSFVSTDWQEVPLLWVIIWLRKYFVGNNDGSNDTADYANTFYEPLNEPLLPALPGNPFITDLNRWQPLALEFLKIKVETSFRRVRLIF